MRILVIGAPVSSPGGGAAPARARPRGHGVQTAAARPASFPTGSGASPARSIGSRAARPLARLPAGGGDPQHRHPPAPCQDLVAAFAASPAGGHDLELRRLPAPTAADRQRGPARPTRCRSPRTRRCARPGTRTGRFPDPATACTTTTRSRPSGRCSALPISRRRCCACPWSWARATTSTALRAAGRWPTPPAIVLEPSTPAGRPPTATSTTSPRPSPAPRPTIARRRTYNVGDAPEHAGAGRARRPGAGWRGLDRAVAARAAPRGDA